MPVNYAPLFAEFERQRFVKQCGVIGHLIVQQFRHACTVVASFDRWSRAKYPDEPATIALVDEFLGSGDLWDYVTPQYRYNQHLLDGREPEQSDRKSR